LIVVYSFKIIIVKLILMIAALSKRDISSHKRPIPMRNFVKYEEALSQNAQAMRSANKNLIRIASFD
jgi:hypothetical protein